MTLSSSQHFFRIFELHRVVFEAPFGDQKLNFEKIIFASFIPFQKQQHATRVEQNFVFFEAINDVFGCFIAILYTGTFYLPSRIGWKSGEFSVHLGSGIH